MKLDSEFLEQSRHVSRLLIHLGLILGKNKNSELRLRELLSGRQDVGHQQGQAAVVVKPVDVDKSFFRLVGSELHHLLGDVAVLDLPSVAVGQHLLGLLLLDNSVEN